MPIDAFAGPDYYVQYRADQLLDGILDPSSYVVDKIQDCKVGIETPVLYVTYANGKYRMRCEGLTIVWSDCDSPTIVNLIRDTSGGKWTLAHKLKISRAINEYHRRCPLR